MSETTKKTSKTLEEGTLIRVRNTLASTDLGALWVVQYDAGPDSGIQEGRIFQCKSINTGECYAWFINEFEVLND